MGSDASSDRSSYDVFLSYNSADHVVVEEIARKLSDEGLVPFLDRWDLAPGMRWRSNLEKNLGLCKAVAIFVGPGEMGSWQQREVDVALDLQSRSPDFPVIPVLLPGCEPPLGFLRQLTWVDLRSQPMEHGIAVLSKAARGEAPGQDLQNHLDSVRTSICPYRGLLHFREEDAPFFFGREAAIDKLVHAVQRQPCVAVVGSSGSGKSSVVRAGLLPRLRKERCGVWETVTLVPTDQPLKALAGTFVPFLEPAASEVERLAEASKLAEHFTSRTISLLDVVLRILNKQPGADRVLIVVDQFEELYTLCSDDNARGRFLDELLTASSCLGSRVTVVIALRGDFVGKAFAHRSLSDRLQDAQVNLGPMTREELESAIRKPAEKIQLEFEPGLVQRILDAVGDAPSSLPLLEFALRELWENRRGQLLLNETYEAMGELKGALAKKASDFFGKLSLADQKVLQRVFLRIVHPSPESGHDTRRRAAFVELPPESRDLVVKLANERLLVTNRSPNGLEQTVEVAHEALISNWSTLRGWINEDREFLLWRERLGALLAEWKRAEGNDDALLRGPLLFEARKWFDRRSQDLSDQEREFIAASRELHERLAREERERQEQKLQSARKLAETERQRAEVESKARRRQGYFIIALIGLLLLAGFVALIAVWEGTSARTAKNTAVTAENRTSEVASQAHVSLARDCHEAGKDAEALGHLAQALRLNQRNSEAAALVGAMLTQTSWPLPVAGPIWHGDLVLNAQFSPDCQRVLTLSNDKTARLWDVANGKEIGELMRHDGWVRSAQFSPNSQWIVTISGVIEVTAMEDVEVGGGERRDSKVCGAGVGCGER